MSNRNRDDREYDERPQAQQNRQQAWSQQQGQYGRPRGNEADDRDVQGNFSANRYGPLPGSMAGSAYESGAYESGYGLRGQESQGYGLQGYGARGSESYGPQSYGAPSTGAGSQGFGPEGYGTSMYEGRGRYTSQSFASQGSQGYGQGGSLREFGSQGPYRQYGLHGQDISGRDIGSSALGQRHLQGESYGRDFGRESLQHSGQQWRNPLEERGHPGYGQSLSSQQHIHGQHSGFDPGMRMGHRGLGPKNYTRSDERIREDLNERLTDADDIDARGLNVEVSNGVATLTGTVEQRWMKHRAEDIAESCSGVRDVNNQIRVQSLHQDTQHRDASSSASQGSARSGSSLGSGGGSSTTSTQASTTPSGSTTSSTGSGSSSTRPSGH